MSTLAFVSELKDAGQDHQWYPTTQEIIQTIVRDIEKQEGDYRFHNSIRVMDVGSGDGRVLKAIDKTMKSSGFRCNTVDLFAIEKSMLHIQNMPKDIIVLGTDFAEQSLVDKPMDVIFCNPPYSEYEQWAAKLIRESCCKVLYLVIPRRWTGCLEIEQAIKARDVEVEVLGSFDFLEADRQARAKVDVLLIDYPHRTSDDVFDGAIEDMLPELKAFDLPEDMEQVKEDADPLAVAVASGNLIESLVASYDAAISETITNYRLAAKLPRKLLEELGVTKTLILKGIREKVSGLKNKYWQILFDKCGTITQRLATKQRKAFLESLTGKHSIDFTESNIFSMLIWITKWSNDYFDQQVKELFLLMSEQANVQNYASNMRTWGKENWRYRSMDEEGPTHYKLEYRVVLERCGGINNSGYQWEAKNGLSSSAFNFLQDCVTVANNLNFACDDGPVNYQWESGKQNVIELVDGKPLMAVRAFKNQNMHVHFNPKFMLALNVEAGRLLGWLKDANQAAEELKATPEEAQEIHKAFSSSFRIEANNLLRIGS